MSKPILVRAYCSKCGRHLFDELDDADWLPIIEVEQRDCTCPDCYPTYTTTTRNGSV